VEQQGPRPAGQLTAQGQRLLRRLMGLHHRRFHRRRQRSLTLDRLLHTQRGGLLPLRPGTGWQGEAL